MSQQQFEERTKWVYDEQTFPVWNESFDKDDRTEMIREDYGLVVVSQFYWLHWLQLV